MRNRYVKSTHTRDTLKAKPSKPPFGYYGAKQRLAGQIVKMLPPHNAWVEGFCGSAALTLAKKPVPIEVINDLDDQIVNVFDQLRKNSKALCEAIALTPYAKQEFELARSSDGRCEPLERARRFLVATMMAVNATVGNTRCGFSFTQSFARQGREARVSRWYNLPERLEKVVERLRGIRVEKRDARTILEMFADRPATLVYLDPPYFTKREHGYVIDARDEEFHQDMLRLCRKARCMLLISGYDNELYDEYLTEEKGWQKHMINTHTRDTTGKDYKRTEVLWTNGVFTKAKELNRPPIRLTKHEIREKKVNPSRKR